MSKLKFKIGDLVMLSAAGRARSGNIAVLGGFGFVTEVFDFSNYPVRTTWWRANMTMTTHPFKEYELKKFKK